MDLFWIGPAALGDDPVAALGAFRSAQARVRVEEAAQIEAAAHFGGLHTDPDTGEVEEFAVVEFAAVAGMSIDSGRVFLIEAVELVTRLPRIWARVRAGEVAGWRGRRVAAMTARLPDGAAGWVDREVVARADKVGPATLEQITAEALARFDPEAALAQTEAALEGREVRIHQAGPIAYVDAILDAADAADLEAVVSTIAGTLDAEESLDVRRSRALGILARGEAAASAAPAGAEGIAVVEPRQVVLHVHLVEGESIASVRSHTGRVLGPTGVSSIDQVREWCHDAGRVVIKPVIDPAQTLTSTGYAPSDRVRDHVVEVCGTCVFPWCHRPAERLDLDHITPYDPGGPPGQTTTSNLAALCRRHHRAKTFTGWTYDQIAPGEFLWTSIYGWRFLRTTEGTTDLGRDSTTHAA